MYYAQLKNGVVTSVTETHSPLPESPDLVVIQSYDTSLLGHSYDGEAFHPPVIALDPRLWWIDTGPFRDRFDIYGYPGLKALILGMARTNDVCYSVVADLQGRLYVDLKGRRVELAVALGKIAAEVAAAGKPEFTSAMQTALLDTPTDEQERYIKGLA